MTGRIIHILKESFGLVLLFVKLFIPDRKLQVLSIYFHNPSAKLFETIILHLCNQGYRIVALEEFDNLIQTRKLKEKIAIITLDDGWRNNLELLDIIKKYKVYITIFVTTSAVEQGNFWFEYVIKGKHQTNASVKREKIRLKKLNEINFDKEITFLKSRVTLQRSALTQDEVVQLSREPLVTIGSHSVRHTSLPYISIEAQRDELSESKKILEKWTGHNINYFAYPSGDYSDKLRVITQECGYNLCFTIDTSFINLEKVDKLLIPRMCVNDDAGLFEALSKMYGLWYKLLKQ